MKVYKGRQKLSLEQAASYYKHAYKIGMEHGRYTEQERLIGLVQAEMPLVLQERFIELIKGEQK